MTNLWKSTPLLMAFLIAVSPSAYAATATQAVNAQAVVDGTLTITVKLFKNDITGTDITASNKFDYGTLQNLGTGTLKSSSTGTGAIMAAGLALITVNSHGLAWSLTETGTNMTSGANTLPVGSLAMNPTYVASDNGGVTDGTMGTKASWFNATAKTLYTSTAAGPLRTIRVYHAITDDPTAGAESAKGLIPLDQKAGTYTGSVTYTATA